MTTEHKEAAVRLFKELLDVVRDDDGFEVFRLYSMGADQADLLYLVITRGDLRLRRAISLDQVSSARFDLAKHHAEDMVAHLGPGL